jgi:hypothetical protein
MSLEIEQLRKDKAELVAALIHVRAQRSASKARQIAHDALRKHGA